MTIGNWKAALVVGLLAAACTTIAAPKFRSVREQDFVGAWQADVGFARWAVIRKQDGTFFEDRLEIRDYAVPKAFRVTARGTWSIRGKYYIRHYAAVNDPASQSLMNRDVKAEITRVTPEAVDYHSKDGPPTREFKIGGQEMELTRIAPKALNRPFNDYTPNG